MASQILFVQNIYIVSNELKRKQIYKNRWIASSKVTFVSHVLQKFDMKLVSLNAFIILL